MAYFSAQRYFMKGKVKRSVIISYKDLKLKEIDKRIATIIKTAWL